ncbi:phosphoglycerate kinase [Candidatus Woesebacteria bacterium]|nr:phosphoglycerate kinase [Candidatus Woesebacteria bacterium]
MEEKHIRFIQDEQIQNKTILLRVDFNVSLNPNNLTIADDARIRQSIPTIEFLLKNNNRIIIASHLGRPKENRDPKYSMKIVCNQLHEYLPNNPIRLINDFLTEDKKTFENQKNNEIYVLENTRYYPGEKDNNEDFAKNLASLAEIYVNDAFGVSHRPAASVVGITKYLPSFGGILLKKEIEMITKVLKNAQEPVVSIVGGAKIDSKIHIIDKLIDISDSVIIGGGLANTFLFAQGYNIGESYAQVEKKDIALELITKAKAQNVELILPMDCIIGNPQELEKGGMVYKIKNVPDSGQILDIGPETSARIGTVIAKAKTIIWNGPVGYFENPHYRQGTDFVYYAITNNTEAISVVGGGDTLAAISKKEYLDKITHISTGGGAMLEFIEKGTLPGIEALKK